MKKNFTNMSYNYEASTAQLRRQAEVQSKLNILKWCKIKKLPLHYSEMKNVRTGQFDTILNEPPVVIIQMRVNTCLPESVPRVITHLETRITDMSFIQNNIKSGSPGMCSNIRPESAYAHTVYKQIHHQRTTKSSFKNYQSSKLNITNSI